MYSVVIVLFKLNLSYFTVVNIDIAKIAQITIITIVVTITIAIVVITVIVMRFRTVIIKLDH
jgi:hypothetical protein